ncbi:MAG: ATPase, T2SS/T4P/T4SS family [Myxococcota bacterium]
MAEGAPKKTQRLGDLLVGAGLVTDDQLKIALAEQARTGSKLGQILVDLGIASDEAISQAVASQNGVEHYDLERVTFEPAAVRCVPEGVARRHILVPISLNKDKLLVAMANPADIMAIDEIERTSDLYVESASASRSQILRALDRVYSSGARNESALEAAIRRATADHDDSDDAASEGGVIGLVEEILAISFRKEATDLHLEPDTHVVRVRFRIDGELVPGPTLVASLLQPIVARIKILAGLDISEKRLPQDGKIRFPYQNRSIDLRVSTFPCIEGESVVIRILDRNRQKLGLVDIGLSESQVETLTEATRRPNGLVLAAGPTGSGKTTTLYALLRAMDTATRKVVTLEDPVEYELPLSAQCQINEKAGLTFASGLRAILRHDPDVILVGEMRDQETCQMAFRASLTGHLVLSTIHTNDSLRSVSRLVDIGVAPFMIASCLAAVSAQRLVRLVCGHCKEEYVPQEHELEAAGIPVGTPGTFVRGAGCDRCHETGMRGREALFEVLRVTPAVAAVIGAGGRIDELESVASSEGLVTFREQAQRSALAGRLPLEEVARVTAEY